MFRSHCDRPWENAFEDLKKGLFFRPHDALIVVELNRLTTAEQMRLGIDGRKHYALLSLINSDQNLQANRTTSAAPPQWFSEAGY